MKDNWYTGKIIRGKGIGKTLGFPTINLENPNVLRGKKEGVYATLVEINDEIYHGVLYYGPRLILNEKENILEIFLFDFDREIYHQRVEFHLKDFIRGVKNFSSFEELKKQVKGDSSCAKKILLQ